jgi:hypothetical protein
MKGMPMVWLIPSSEILTEQKRTHANENGNEHNATQSIHLKVPIHVRVWLVSTARLGFQ